jgi:hypothetical protein
MNPQGSESPRKPNVQNAGHATWNPNYDFMGRLNGLSANARTTAPASNVTYGPAGE